MVVFRWRISSDTAIQTWVGSSHFYDGCLSHVQCDFLSLLPSIHCIRVSLHIPLEHCGNLPRYVHGGSTRYPYII